MALKNKSTEEASLQLYTNNWKEEILETEGNTEIADQVVILAGGSVRLAEKLTENLGEEVIAVNSGTETEFFQEVLKIVQSKIKQKERTELRILWTMDLSAVY